MFWMAGLYRRNPIRSKMLRHLVPPAKVLRRLKAWRKEHGLPYHSHPPPGHVRLRKRVPGQAKPILLDVWDGKQCDLIREIKYRSDRGERMADIADDFRQRGEKMWNGKPWTQTYGARKRVNLSRYYRAYWFYTELLASGKDLMDLPCTEEAPERAKRRLKTKQRRQPGKGK